MFCLKVRASSEETAKRRGREEKDELQRNGDINRGVKGRVRRVDVSMRGW